MKITVTLPRLPHIYTTTFAKRLASKTSQSLLVTPPTDIPHIFGYCITKGGEVLFLQRESEKKNNQQIRFINRDSSEVGYIELIPIHFLLNYFFVSPNHRGRGLSASMLAAVLKSIEKRQILDFSEICFSIYIQNPLLARLFTRFGFTPSSIAPGLETQLVLAKQPDKRHIPLYVADPQKRENLREHINNPENTDWHIFTIMEEPIDGDEIVIHARYYLTNLTTFENQLRQDPTQVFFY